MGDSQITSAEASLNFDTTAFYTNWIQVIPKPKTAARDLKLVRSRPANCGCWENMAGIQRHAAPRLHAEGPARPRGHAVLRVDALLLRLLLQLSHLHRLQLHPHPGRAAGRGPIPQPLRRLARRSVLGHGRCGHPARDCRHARRDRHPRHVRGNHHKTIYSPMV